MCGIAGYLVRSGKAPDSQVLPRMAEVLAHRGPDDAGFHVDPDHGVGLAHRRLSIIDLSSAGHQPMAREDGRTWITFNGEIYNYLELMAELETLGYRFHSATDTEVVLQAYACWGEACLQRFNGMFAFVLWDGERRQLFAARDRFGEKPFYYLEHEGTFYFASEIKALLQVPGYRPRPNERAIAAYLDFGILDVSAETFFEGIMQLEPAHCLLLREGPLAIRRYWELKPRLDSITDADALEQFEALLQDSIRLRLRSDVPVGACLSGGLDSSTIVSLANARLAKTSQRMKTFTCAYPDADCDERGFTEEVVARSGADAYFITPEVQGLVGRISELLRFHDEPFSTLGVFSQWSVMGLAKQNGVTVLLDGQGADEILGGYLWFLRYSLADLLRAGRWGELVRELAAHRKHYGEPLGKMLRDMVAPILPGRLKRWLRPELGLPSLPAEAGPNTLTRQMRTSLQLYNLRAYLRYEDRNSMAFSLEARLPFLDHRLVEFAYTLPNRMKIRRATTKWLLRQAMRETLPPALLERRDKMGYATPSNAWLQSEERQAIMEVLGAPGMRERAWFRRADVQAHWARFQAGDPGELSIIWQYVILELWYRRFIDRETHAISVPDARLAL